MKSWQLWVSGIVVLGLLVVGIDYKMATAKLDGIEIATTVDPPQVVADGRNQVLITLHVTEDGEPRADDLIQSWLGVGGGLLIPNWVVTDENGMAQITYTPNPYSPYDPQEFVEINVSDTSIGQIVEVDKREVVQVSLLDPT